MGLAAARSTNVLWFITRGTGVVSLVLLTIVMALGVANVRRLRTAAIPRFVLDAVHRNAALLAVSFLAVHIVTTLFDPYVSINPLAAVVPFASSYRPLWIGLGAVSLDLLFAVLITSLLRRRLGHRVWRATHWLAYGSWPVALFHSLGAGSDASSRWMLALAAACTVTVLGAVALRMSGTYDDRASARSASPPRRSPRVSASWSSR
jgi:methionine sulfoxide reductase heme-binding subunit